MSCERQRFLPATNGNVTLLFALVLPILIGMGALAVDVSNFYLVQRTLQTAADAGALAAVLNLDDTSLARSEGLKYALLNTRDGYGNITTTSDVEIGNYNSTTKVFTKDSSPLNAARVFAARDSQHNNQASWILADILFSASKPDIKRIAIAVATPAKACVISLADKGANTFAASGGGTVSVPKCGIYVNSKDRQALYQSGTGSIRAASIDVVGGYYSAGTYSPTPTTNQTPIEDPLLYLPEPTPSGCTYYNQTFNRNVVVADGTVFCGTTIFRGDVIFQPGVIYFVGANVSVGSNITLKGSNVTLYFDSQSSLDATGSGTIDITAPSTGTYAGVAIFGSRNSSTMPIFKLTGSKQYSVKGTIYLPKALLQINGQSDLNVKSDNGYVVAWQFLYQGNSSLNVDSFGGVVPSGLSGKIALVK